MFALYLTTWQILFRMYLRFFLSGRRERVNRGNPLNCERADGVSHFLADFLHHGGESVCRKVLEMRQHHRWRETAPCQLHIHERDIPGN